MYLPLDILLYRWWKQLNVATNLSFIRDRIVEMYFWMTGACSDQKHSLARAITTKMTAYITIFDHIMDTHSTSEEAMLLAEAIYRYEQSSSLYIDIVTLSLFFLKRTIL